MADRIRVTLLMSASLRRGGRLVSLGGQPQLGGDQVVGLPATRKQVLAIGAPCASADCAHSRSTIGIGSNGSSHCLARVVARNLPQPACLAHRGDLSRWFSGRALSAATAADLSDWLSSLALACCAPLPLAGYCCSPSCSFSPAPPPRLPSHRWPGSSRPPPAPAGVPSSSTP